jgi:hypothetical protein
MTDDDLRASLEGMSAVELVAQLSGFQTSAWALGKIGLEHRCGWESKAIDNGLGYLGNLVALAIDHRHQGCRP